MQNDEPLITINKYSMATARGLMLFSILLVSSLANAQWDHNSIETLSDEADRLKEQGLFASAYDLYPQIMYQMRIYEGLFSANQLPLLMEMAAWHERRSELAEADSLLDRAEYYAGKNPDPENNYRRLVLQRIYLPDEKRCFERNQDRFLNPSKGCEKQRYYRADSFIAATNLMIKIVEISDHQKTDLITLAGLAQFTAFCVYGVDGPSVIVESKDNMLYMSDNTQVRERYRYQKWERVQRRVLKQLKNEFEYEV